MFFELYRVDFLVYPVVPFSILLRHYCSFYTFPSISFDRSVAAGVQGILQLIQRFSANGAAALKIKAAVRQTTEYSAWFNLSLLAS